VGLKELIMKRLLLIVLPLLLIVGCSSPEPINYETTLVERDDVYYTKDTNKPYSGQVFSLYDDGKKKGEGNLKDGKMISKTERKYYGNGQKRKERTFKNGIENGLRTDWYENGQREIEQTYKDGKGNGLSTYWYESGQKWSQVILKDGRLDGLLTKWYKNGQKELENTLKDGKQDGLLTKWYKNGQKKSEETYKDGEMISEKEWNKDGSVKE